MTNFAQLASTRKGNIGEEIVRDMLTGWGYTVYSPPAGRTHPIDFIAAKPDELTAIDVKTYPRLFLKPYTGIDAADWHTYINLPTQGAPVRLFWVDEFERMVYGQRIERLAKVVTFTKDKALFPLSAMTAVRSLTDAECNALMDAGRVDYSQYNGTTRYFQQVGADAADG